MRMAVKGGPLCVVYRHITCGRGVTACGIPATVEGRGHFKVVLGLNSNLNVHPASEGSS